MAPSFCRGLLYFGLLLALAGCNYPQRKPGMGTPSLSVTEAYQTVGARLTEIAALTPRITTPIPVTDTQVAPTFTALSETFSASPTAAQPQPTATNICDRASAGDPIDVTIPDDTKIEAGDAFTKIWRLQNVGACTWTRDYSIDFFSGEPMGAQSSFAMPGQVPPGQSVDISIDFIAPETSGTHQGNWKLRNPADDWFGIGPNGSAPFWVRIEVVDEVESTLTPTPTSTAIGAATATATSTPDPSQPGVQASGTVNLSLGDGIDLDTGQSGTDDQDLFLDRNSEGKLLLSISSRLLVGVYGSDQPTIEDCRAAAKGPGGLFLADYNEGTYLCYLTNSNLTGWAMFNSINLERDRLGLQFYTWNTP